MGMRFSFVVSWCYAKSKDRSVEFVLAVLRLIPLVLQFIGA